MALSPARTSPKVWSQIFLPVSASSAITWAFRGDEDLPVGDGDPAVDVAAAQRHVERDACLYCQQRSGRASRAQTQPSQPETNMMPSTTIGEASNE